MWKGNGNTTLLLLLFSLKGLGILHEERRGQVNTIIMEHFNRILLNKSGPAKKQHTNHSSICGQVNVRPSDGRQALILSGLLGLERKKKRRVLKTAREK